MGADADHHQPGLALHARLVGLRVAQLTDVDGLGFLDLLGRAVAHEDRLAAPHHGHGLALGHVGDVHVGAGQRQHVLGRVHGSDERPDNGTHTDRREGARNQFQEIPFRPVGRGVLVPGAVGAAARRKRIGHASSSLLAAALHTGRRAAADPIRIEVAGAIGQA